MKKIQRSLKMFKIIFLLIFVLLITGCETVKPVDKTVDATKAVAKGTVNATKAVAKGTVRTTRTIANGTVTTTKVVVDKFGVYPYEPDAHEMIEIQENKQHEVPFTFFKLEF
jgi:hypothetical protein